MTASQRALSAYGNAQSASKSASQIEYQAFAKVTNRMTKNHSDDPIERALKFADLAAAMHDNLKLWTIVAGDVAQENNGLPEKLRAQLFYLAEFTRVHTQRVLKGETGPAPLIDINTSIMRGLRQQSEAEACPA